jgi:hypothetical protein
MRVARINSYEFIKSPARNIGRDPAFARDRGPVPGSIGLNLTAAVVSVAHPNIPKHMVIETKDGRNPEQHIGLLAA